MGNEDEEKVKNGPTKICKYCQSEISKKSKICPVCKKKQGGGIGCGTVILAAIILFIIFAALGGSGSSSKNNDNENTKQIVADGSDTATSSETKKSENSKSKSKTPTIDEQVIVDNAGIKITAKKYSTDSIWGDGIDLEIENNTDKDYTIGCDALIVNDYMISDLFVSEVAAGKKANESMYLSSSELEAAGIDTVGKIEMYFHAYDSDYNDLFTNLYSEIHTSEYDNMDTTADDSGVELYNANGIRIVGKTVDEDSFWGKAILLYVENTSGANVGISVDNLSINGTMIDPYFSTTVYSGKKDFDDITLLSSDLEKNGITSIDNVELKFHIYNNDTFETIADTDAISFSAK